MNGDDSQNHASTSYAHACGWSGDFHLADAVEAHLEGEVQEEQEKGEHLSTITRWRHVCDRRSFVLASARAARRNI